MALNILVTGVLTKDPFGSESYTMWKIRSFSRDITLFSQDNASESRLNYRNEMRIRAEGRGAWNEFNDTYSLQVSGCGIDSSDDDEDSLKIKVDGSLNHEIEVEQDDADEGGGRYIHVEIEAPIRVKKGNDWEDGLAYVRGIVLQSAVDKLIELDNNGVTSICFTGHLDADPCWIKGEPGFYAEFTDVAPSQGRGTDNSDDFWKSKPKGLANRKSSSVTKAAPPKQAGGKPGKPSKKGGSYSYPGPNDDLPFMYEWR